MKGLVMGALALVWVVGSGLFLGGPVGFALLGLALGLGLTMAQAWCGPLGSIQVERILPPGPVRAGDTVTVRLRVHSRRWWPWLLLRLRDEWEPAVPAADAAACEVRLLLLPGRTAEVSYRLPRVRRGVYSLRSLRLTASDPFGFVRRERQVVLPGVLEAWPVPAPAREIRGLLAAAGSSAQTMTALARAASEAHAGAAQTGETRGIRPYAPGDPLRHIHWPATAKTGRLAVREFEPAGRRPLHVVVAAGESTSAAGGDRIPGRHVSAEPFEWVLSQAAGVIDWGLREQRPIALTIGPSHIAAARGQAHTSKLMRLLATCQPSQVDGAAASPPVVAGASVIRVTGEVLT